MTARRLRRRGLGRGGARRGRGDSAVLRGRPAPRGVGDPCDRSRRRTRCAPDREPSTTSAARGAPVAFWDWHGQVEAHLRASEVPSVILRSSTYMSNLFVSAGQIAGEGKLVAPAGEARIAMIDPRGVGDAAAIVLTGWRGEEGCSTGPGRASTTSSRRGWRGSDTSRRGASPARPASAPSTRSPRRASRRCASTRGRPSGSRRSRATPCSASSSATSSESPSRARAWRRSARTSPTSWPGSTRARRPGRHYPTGRRKYLPLIIGFLRRYLELHVELVDEIERGFDAGDQRAAS